MAMFTFSFTADMPRIQRAVLRLLTPRHEERVGWTWDTAIVQTGGYFSSRMLLMLISLWFFVTMESVGVPVGFALTLAVFGSFVSVFIPAVGTDIGGAVPCLVTLAVAGWVPALIVLGYVLVYQQIENYWLSPRISADTMSIDGGLAFGAAIAGGRSPAPCARSSPCRSRRSSRRRSATTPAATNWSTTPSWTTTTPDPFVECADPSIRLE